MSIKVTSNRSRQAKGTGWWNSSRAYVDSNATKFIDEEFFAKNKIYMHNFKCKAWAAIGREAHKLNIAEMETILGNKAEIVYSHKAGCSCGCSPGYKVSNIDNAEYRGKDIWFEIEVDITALKAMLPKFEAKLKKEILDNEAKLNKISADKIAKEFANA
jgi:hypothetical protein